MSTIHVCGRYIVLFDNATLPATVTNGMEYIRESDLRKRQAEEAAKDAELTTLRQRAEAAETKAAQCEREKAMLRDAFTAESKQLAVRVRELEGVITDLEWVPMYGESSPHAPDTCPWCDQTKRQGHNVSCKLKAAIDAAGGEA